MALIRVLSRLALIFVTVALVAFVVFNYGSFLVTVQSLEFRYWVGPNDSIHAPETPLFVFSAGFFVLGVVLMGLASMQVYLDLAASWRRLRKERKSYEPERRELERARASLAREREDHEPKLRELEFRVAELDHRAEGSSAIARRSPRLEATWPASVRSSPGERAEVGAERNAVERERTQVEASRSALARQRARAEVAIPAVPAVAHETRPDSAVRPPAAGPAPGREPSQAGEGEAAADETEPEVEWDLAERLDDDVAAVARLAQEDPAEGASADAAAESEGSPIPKADEDPEPSR
ncbi:MAG: hypothetical protein IPK07_29290 [Deltaproteobacteria bacterium]|nr:hypothetical protein [Deltaproteobacteria bacterium]